MGASLLYSVGMWTPFSMVRRGVDRLEQRLLRHMTMFRREAGEAWVPLHWLVVRGGRTRAADDMARRARFHHGPLPWWDRVARARGVATLNQRWQSPAAGRFLVVVHVEAVWRPRVLGRPRGDTRFVTGVFSAAPLDTEFELKEYRQRTSGHRCRRLLTEAKGRKRNTETKRKSDVAAL